MSNTVEVGIILGFRIEDLFSKEKVNEVSLLLSEKIDSSNYKSLRYVHISDSADMSIIVGLKSENDIKLNGINNNSIIQTEVSIFVP